MHHTPLAHHCPHMHQPSWEGWHHLVICQACTCCCGKHCASAERQCGSQEPHLDVCVRHMHAALQRSSDLRQPRRQRPERMRGFHQVGGHGVAPMRADGNGQPACMCRHSVSDLPRTCRGSGRTERRILGIHTNRPERRACQQVSRDVTSCLRECCVTTSLHTCIEMASAPYGAAAPTHTRHTINNGGSRSSTRMRPQLCSPHSTGRQPRMTFAQSAHPAETAGQLQVLSCHVSGPPNEATSGSDRNRDRKGVLQALDSARPARHTPAQRRPPTARAPPRPWP